MMNHDSQENPVKLGPAVDGPSSGTREAVRRAMSGPQDPTHVRDARGFVVILAFSVVALAWFVILRHYRAGLPGDAPVALHAAALPGRDLPEDSTPGSLDAKRIDRAGAQPHAR